VGGVIIDTEVSERYLGISTENGVDIIRTPLKEYLKGHGERKI